MLALQVHVLVGGDVSGEGVDRAAVVDDDNEQRQALDVGAAGQCICHAQQGQISAQVRACGRLSSCWNA